MCGGTHAPERKANRQRYGGGVRKRERKRKRDLGDKDSGDSATSVLLFESETLVEQSKENPQELEDWDSLFQVAEVTCHWNCRKGNVSPIAWSARQETIFIVP